LARNLVVLSSYDPSYLRVFEHVIGLARDSGMQSMVLDVTPVSAGGFDTYHRGVLRALRIPIPGHDLRQRLSEYGAEVLDIIDVLSTAPEYELTAEAADGLAISVPSGLITYTRTDRPNLKRRSVSRVRDDLEREGLSVYRAMRYLLAENPDVNQVVVPNGRFPHQKMATIAAQEAGVSRMHIEHGETPDGAYFQGYAPHHRLAAQKGITEVLAGHSREEIIDTADQWLEHRQPSKDSRNEFAALWQNGLPSSLTAGHGDTRKIAGLFTSSQDEYDSLGPEWQLHSWSSQFEAFDSVLTRLQDAGYRCYLRVHPNLATKADDAFRRERDAVRALGRNHPELVTIWHDDFANTYRLLDATDLVVVWDSTVGMEASARGLPVWTMATSRYGATADVKEVLSAEALGKVTPGPWEVDEVAAKNFIAYMVFRETKMSIPRSAWEPWDEKNPPRGLLLARIAASGGNPTVTSAIWSLVDVYRHRALRSNLRSLFGR
jgi:hypothetical protein